MKILADFICNCSLQSGVLIMACMVAGPQTVLTLYLRVSEEMLFSLFLLRAVNVDMKGCLTLILGVSIIIGLQSQRELCSCKLPLHALQAIIQYL